MKRFTVVMLLAVFMVLFAAFSSFAAGTVTATVSRPDVNDWDRIIVLVLTCTGDSVNGSIPDTSTNALSIDGTSTDVDPLIKGLQLVRVIVENTTAQTDTDADADVYFKDSGGTDFMAGQGVDQLDNDTRNYLRMNQYDPVIGTMTYSVANQSQASAVWTTTFVFAK